MSVIGSLGENNKNLPSILSTFDNDLSQAEDIIRIKGKKLEHANRENPAWQIYFDQRRIELHTLVKYFEALVKKTRGKLFVSFMKNSSIEMSDRARDKQIDTEPAYLEIYEIYLEVNELYEKFQSVVDTLQSRGYALNNITKIRVASLEDAEI